MNVYGGPVEAQKAPERPLAVYFHSSPKSLRKRAVVQLACTGREGYVTTDDEGTGGDDTPHCPVPFVSGLPSYTANSLDGLNLAADSGEPMEVICNGSGVI